MATSTNTINGVQIPDIGSIEIPDASELLAEVNTISLDSVLADMVRTQDASKPIDTSWLMGHENDIVESVVPKHDTASSKDADERRQYGTGDPVDPSNSPELPGVMKDMTGVETWEELGVEIAKTLGVGLASMLNPTVGGVVGGTLNAAEDDEITGAEVTNIVEDAVLGFSGVGLVTGLAEAAAEVAGVYNTQDGIINSIVDVLNGSESISTTAGFMAAGGIMGQIAQEQEDDFTSNVLGKQSIGQDFGRTSLSDQAERNRQRARDQVAGASTGQSSSLGSGVSVGESMTGQHNPAGPSGGSTSDNSSSGDRGSDKDRGGSGRSDNSNDASDGVGGSNRWR